MMLDIALPHNIKQFEIESPNQFCDYKVHLAPCKTIEDQRLSSKVLYEDARESAAKGMLVLTLSQRNRDDRGETRRSKSCYACTLDSIRASAQAEKRWVRGRCLGPS